MWSAIPVALLCIIVNWSERKQGSGPKGDEVRGDFVHPFAYALRLWLRLRSEIGRFPIFRWRLGLSGNRDVIVRISPRATRLTRRRVNEILCFWIMRRRSRRRRDDRFED